MKFYKFNNAYFPASSKEVFLTHSCNDQAGTIEMFETGVQHLLIYSTKPTPIDLAKQIFAKIGEHLVEKTIIDIDLIVEKLTQQYEYDQKTNGEVKE